MSRPQEALEFFQAIHDGAIQFNSADPSHRHALKAALEAVERYAQLATSAPELVAGAAALGGKATSEEELTQQLQALEGVLSAVEGKRDQLEERLRALRAAATAASAPSWAPGGPDAPWFPGVVAVDIGSSNVVCAHWNYQANDPVVSTLEPVAVNVLDAAGFSERQEGSFLTGEAALTHKRQANLYRSFRRLLGTQTRSRPAVTGGHITQVAVSDLMAAVLEHLLRKVSREVANGPIHFPQLFVTVPATGDAAFEYELRQVCERIGVTVTSELDEATAAGVYYLLRPLLLRDYARERRADGQPGTPADYYAKHFALGEEGIEVLAIDLGGDSTDLALLRLHLIQDDRSCRVNLEVAGTAGFRELSGEGLTLFLFGLLKRRLALALAHPRRALAGARPDLEPPHLHPWLEYHRLEVGATDVTLAGRLDKGYRLLLERWDEVAGTGPLDAALSEAVDAFFPTVSEGAAKKGAKFRKANFRWLWEETERVKRALCAQRDEEERLAGAAGATQIASRLDLSSVPRQPHGLDFGAWLSKSRVDPSAPPQPLALAVGPSDVDAFVRATGAAPLARAARSLLGERLPTRVLLAGNGARAARPVIEEVFASELGLSAERISFSPDDAKVSVAKGACLWAVGNRLEGIEVSLQRSLRHPAGLVLVSALRQEPLFPQGTPIDRFCYAQPEAREDEAGEKLIQVDRELGGRLTPFLMFDPRRGEPLPALGSLPAAKREDLSIPAIDAFCEQDREAVRCTFRVRDPHQYVQTDSAEWVSQGEVFSALRRELSMVEAIAWVEGAEHLRSDPPPGKAWHRYYVDENLEVYLVFHAAGRKLLVRGDVVEQARRALLPAEDPFSGVH